MKTSVRVIAAVAIYLAAQNSFSQTGFGSPDCGQWLAEKTSTRQSWLAGYLSGLNMGVWVQLERNPLDRLSSMAQAYAWMDNWCKKNPLERVSSGGQALIMELMEREEKAKARK